LRPDSLIDGGAGGVLIDEIVRGLVRRPAGGFVDHDRVHGCHHIAEVGPHVIQKRPVCRLILGVEPGVHHAASRVDAQEALQPVQEFARQLVAPVTLLEAIAFALGIPEVRRAEQTLASSRAIRRI
jgi:hypothetical protein